jgi:hypothetical protein
LSVQSEVSTLVATTKHNMGRPLDYPTALAMQHSFFSGLRFLHRDKPAGSARQIDALEVRVLKKVRHYALGTALHFVSSVTAITATATDYLSFIQSR